MHPGTPNQVSHASHLGPLVLVWWIHWAHRFKLYWKSDVCSH